MVRSSFSYSYSLFLVLFLSFAFSSHSIKPVKVEDICNQLREAKGFCTSFLNSRPRDVGEDLYSLGLYTANAISTNLTNTINLIKTLLKTTKDHDIKALYFDCAEQYGDLRTYTETAKACLSAHKCSVDVSRVGGDVESVADDCAGNNGEVPLPDKNPVRQNSLIIEYLAVILLIIGNLLQEN